MRCAFRPGGRNRVFLGMNIEAGIAKRSDSPGYAARHPGVSGAPPPTSLAKRRKFSASGESPCALAIILGATCSQRDSPVAAASLSSAALGIGLGRRADARERVFRLRERLRHLPERDR